MLKYPKKQGLQNPALCQAWEQHNSKDKPVLWQRLAVMIVSWLEICIILNMKYSKCFYESPRIGFSKLQYINCSQMLSVSPLIC